MYEESKVTWKLIWDASSQFQVIRFGLVWFGLVWYGFVWFETTPIQGYYESFIKIQLVLAVLEKNVS